MRQPTIAFAPGRTPFIGRSRERALLEKEIRTGARLVTITGPSGMGKTRLALEVLDALRDHFVGEGSAWFVSLVGCRNERDLRAAVARVLGIPEEHGPQLAELIGSGRPRILVLDNVDALAKEAAAVVESLLDHCEGLQILVTSLVPLGTDDEVRFELGQLEVADAVELFLDRMHRAWADRASPPEERPLVEELVRRLDRIPLAIELAAARARILPPKALLSRISERFDLLQTGKPGRHSSLMEALSLSWDLLETREREALARASVFLGGFSLEAAKAVLLGNDASFDELTLLDGLRNKALLQLDEADPPRFSPYETVREFAARHLETSGLRDETIRRHTAFFLEHGEFHAARVDGPEAAAAIRWLATERENLLVAHRNCLESDAETAARIGLALAAVVALQGPPDSELELLDSVVRAARTSADQGLLLRALQRRGTASVRLGKLDLARDDFEEALELAHNAGEAIQEASVRIERSGILIRGGEFAKALEELEFPIRIAKECDEPMLEGRARVMMGVVEDTRVDHNAARVHFEKALAIFRRLGNREMEGRCVYNLSVVESGLARFREARLLLDECRAIFRSLGHRAAESYAMVNRGAVDLAAGYLDEAERITNEALRLGTAQSHRRFGGLAIGNLGLISLERGEIRVAEQRLMEAYLSFEESGDQANRFLFLGFLGVAEALLGRQQEAKRSLAEAVPFFKTLGSKNHLRLVDVLGAIVDVAEARRLADLGREREALALEEHARSILDRAHRGENETIEVFVGIRLLEKALDGHASLITTSLPDGLLVGPDASWFERRGGMRVDLRRRQAVRRLFSLLVEQRLRQPGVSLSSEELFERAWGGEGDVHPESARARLHTSVWTLRALGLANALVRTEEGYMLDPSLPVVRAR